MAPKRKPVKTVVTAKKVVEETVEVEVTADGKENVISSCTKANKSIQVLTTPLDENDKETQPASEPQTIPEPYPSVETPRKTEEKAGKSKRRRRRNSVAGEGGEGYKTYVYKVMKQVHPELGISSKAMTIINNYMSDMFERLADEAAKLLKYTGKHTLSSREVQGAVKLVLPGELGKHAIAEGTKAVTNYVNFGHK